MLRYKFLLDNTTSSVELDCREVYVSDDLSYMSGVTDYKYDIHSGDNVIVRSPYNGTDVLLPITVKSVIRQGYVLTNELYAINTIHGYSTYVINPSGDTYYIDYNGNIIYKDYNTDTFTVNGYIYNFNPGDGTLLVEEEVKYIEYDGVYYYRFSNDFVSGFLINNKFYEETSDGYVRIPTKHYIEDRKVVIKGVEYDVDIDYSYNPTYKNENDMPVIRQEGVYDPISYIDNKPIQFFDYESERWHYVNKFEIYGPNFETIGVNSARIVSYSPYIEYGDNTYDLNYYRNSDDEYVFGVKIDDNVYKADEFYVDGIMPVKSYIYTIGNQALEDLTKIQIGDEYYNVFQRLDYDAEGALIAIDVSDTSIMLNIGDIIRCSAYTYNETYMLYIEDNPPVDESKAEYLSAETETGDIVYYIDESSVSGYTSLYLTYNGKRYYAVEHLCDVVEINGIEYDITYTVDDMTQCIAFVNDKEIVFKVIKGDDGWSAQYKDNVIIVSKKKWYIPKLDYMTTYASFEEAYNVALMNGYTEKDVYETVLTDYAKQSESDTIKSYPIIQYSGVTIDGRNFRITHIDDNIVEGDNIRSFEAYYATISGKREYSLYISDIYGPSTLICEPVISESIGNEINYSNAVNLANYRNTICSDISKNFSDFRFYKSGNIFAFSEKYPENGIYAALNSTSPLSSNDLYDITDGLRVFAVGTSMVMPIELSSKSSSRLQLDDLVQNYYTNDVIEDNINGFVDMEKDIYYPVFLDGDKYNLIDEIRFNFHFRTRDSEWNIINDESEEVGIWNGVNVNSTTREVTSSDDTYSFVSDVNRFNSNWFVLDLALYKNVVESGETVVLQNTSDLIGLLNFDDADVKYRKKRLSKSFIRLSFYSTNDPMTQMLLYTSTIFLDENQLYQKYTQYADSQYIYGTINTSLDNIDDYYVDSGNSINVLSEKDDNEFNDNFRLSSRVSITNKYNTKSSSDGFYIYMFKEYSNGIEPVTVYMRVDFFHAGIGRSFPFYIPTVDEGNITRPCIITSGADRDVMKRGISIDEIGKRLYIPVKLIYDIKNNRYVYYLPDNYRENIVTGVDDNIMEFNLFELKLQNESYQ